MHRLSRHKAEADSLDELADEVVPSVAPSVVRLSANSVVLSVVPFADPFVVLSLVLSEVLSVVPSVHKAEADSPDELVGYERPHRPRIVRYFWCSYLCL